MARPRKPDDSGGQRDRQLDQRAHLGQGGAFQQVILNNQNAAAGEEEAGLGAEGGARMRERWGRLPPPTHF